ncbi:MAG: Nif3-like dinuclear metal center hexameric protein [Halanaerobiales bacterium]
MNGSKLVSIISQLIPDKFSCEWDNCGIQVATDMEKQINKILITLDVNMDILKEAENKNCDMILSHHPLIFDSLNSITNKSLKEKIIIKAIKNDIIIYTAHTNLDIAPEGLNSYLAQKLKLQNIKPLKITDTEKLYKLIVYIPEDNLEKVREAILDAGAGHIGNYSHTSFSIKGEGTFKPLSESNPYSGKIGEINKTNEYKWETIIKKDQIEIIKSILFKVHPYEEVAYDLYSLNNSGEKYGIGRIGDLSDRLTLENYLDLIKKKLDIDYRIKYLGNNKKEIKKVALCSGSGADFITDAKKAGADVYITGDIKFHEAQLAEAIDLPLIDAGHYDTEKVVKDFWLDKFKELVDLENEDIKLIKSQINTNPWKKY